MRRIDFFANFANAIAGKVFQNGKLHYNKLTLKLRINYKQKYPESNGNQELHHH